MSKPPADSHDLIRVHGARVNNLKDVSVEIPKRRLTVFTGVSGSGKSSLVFDTIAAEAQRQLNAPIIIDQSRVTANRRSAPATYAGIMDDIRQAFARANHASPSLFSFN